MGLRDRIRAQVGQVAGSLVGGLKQGIKQGLEHGIEFGKERLTGRSGSTSSGESDFSGTRVTSRSGQFAAFSDAGDTGLDAWLEQIPRLEGVGLNTVALFQNRFVASELQLREALDGLEALAATRTQGAGIAAWRQVCEQLASLWQQQNARISERWGAGFVGTAGAWRSAGESLKGHPWPDALSASAVQVDKTWLNEWENFQALLEDISLELKKGFEQCAATPQLSSAVNAQQWQRALSLVDGGIRRAQGDLWGAWGTQASLLRGYARKVNEGEGTLRTLYPPAFDRMTHAFDQVIRANVTDLGDSWLEAVKVLKTALQAQPPLES